MVPPVFGDAPDSVFEVQNKVASTLKTTILLDGIQNHRLGVLTRP